MKVAIFDLETSNFNADSGIVLCCCIKEYGKPGVKTLRGDRYKTWKNQRSNDGQLVHDILEELDKYDIVVAHNGEWFDKGFLNAKALEHRLKPIVRMKKSIDPVLAGRRYMRMGRNSLTSFIDYFDVPCTKSPIRFKYWKRATLDGCKKSMGYIVRHCVRDVISLEQVYDRIRPLIDKIDNKGSSH